ncbi:hypothetical protein [Archangium sp.]|uniref:hypothetical protein n=1 Tax=Archangium sp. TaxID=1872627 RepID=UPI002D31E7F0|nr:hypothetical protein [Archangium sp.]HYO53821.1 hypothetical protein [Archangium sp.]
MPPVHTAITGLGMCSSLGLVIDACAAARAGLRRAAELDFMEVDEDTLESALGPGPSIPPAAAFAGEEDLSAEALLRATLHSLPERLLAGALPGTRLQTIELSCGGPAAFARLLQRAHHLLTTRTVERCIVGGLDSLVHGDALLAARELGLVRNPNSPIGFLPGEAAGFLLLETVRTARARGARIEAHLGPVAFAEEDFDRFSRVAPSGKALQAAISTCFQQWGAQGAEVGVAVVNLNGDTFRSRDFGSALVRMAAAGLPTGFRTVLPVDSFGELGAATGPVSLCLAVRSLVRRYARTQNLLVLLLDERRLRSALLVHAPQPEKA